MRVLRSLLLCVLALVIPATADTGIGLDEFKQRRAELRKELGGATFILFGATEKQHEIRSAFYQEPNFYYFTGWTEPGAILVLTKTSDILLLPPRNKDAEKWTGAKMAYGDPNLESVTGFSEILPVTAFEKHLPELVATSQQVATLTSHPRTEALRTMLPLRELKDVSTAVAKLRMSKSPAEIELIQRATDIAVEAHKAGWLRAAPGVYEYQVASAISNAYFEAGCQRHAYLPISGSGMNATVLHYGKNERRMDAGELLLMDIGPECDMYATDITRTIPVSGKFNPRQREIYEIVLGAQKAAIAAVKPGAFLGTRHDGTGLQDIAKTYIDSHGKDKNGEKLGKYFTHGLGHHVGLDVHDPQSPVPLKAGMIFTIEPGIYIPEEGIGVRIEDVVLVTEDGSRVLSSSLPREVDDIEQFMAKQK